MTRVRLVLAFFCFVLALGFHPETSAQCLPDPAGPAVFCPAPAAIEAPPPGPCPIGDLVFVDKTTLTWTFPVACAFPPLFDVARGDLDCLRSGVRVSVSCELCLPGEESSGVDFVAVDPAVPLPGEGYWYLIRVDAATWNAPGFTHETNYNPVVPDITGCF